MKLNLDYQFKNPQLLKTALTHRSYLNEHRQEKLQSNERLEFLGDAILELIVSLYLFKKYPSLPEGRLTTMRAQLVQTKTLSLVSQKLKVGFSLRLSRGEKESGGNNNPSLLADTFEAIVGAIYQDSNFEQAYKFVEKNLLIPSEEIFKSQLPHDYKSQLQEVIQGQGLNSPVYKLVQSLGPDHNKTFKTNVIINNKKSTEGAGKSKQEAEQEAACKALEKFKRK